MIYWAWIDYFVIHPFYLLYVFINCTLRNWSWNSFSLILMPPYDPHKKMGPSETRLAIYILLLKFLLIPVTMSGKWKNINCFLRMENGISMKSSTAWGLHWKDWIQPVIIQVWLWGVLLWQQILLNNSRNTFACFISIISFNLKI